MRSGSLFPQAHSLLRVPTIEQRGSTAAICAQRSVSALAPLCKGSWPRSGLKDCQTPDLPGALIDALRQSIPPPRCARHLPLHKGGKDGRKSRIGRRYFNRRGTENSRERFLRCTFVSRLPPCAVGAPQRFMRKSRFTRWLPCVKGAGREAA